MKKVRKASAFAVLRRKTESQSSPSEKTLKPKLNGVTKKAKRTKATKEKFDGRSAPSYNNLDKSPGAGLQARNRATSSFSNITQPSEQKTHLPGNLKRARHSQETIRLDSRLTLVRDSNGDESQSENRSAKKSRKSEVIAKGTKVSVASAQGNGVEIVQAPVAHKLGQSSSSDSRADAQKCFDWLICPVKRDNFFEEVWEKKPLLVKRHHTKYYRGIFGCADLDAVLRDNCVLFNKNLDVTSYVDGKRETHNPNGRAYPAVVWDYYQNGCSVRMLNPQTFSKPVWKLLSILQEHFGSCVGANIYLTPPGSQGFAPHYDDIEAFVLQLEGRKRWKLYSPRNFAETLPKYSSGNFKPTEIGEPILNIELEPGDLLYFPRGTIHQASTPEDVHSLHITVSTCQRNTWADYFEKLMPAAVQMAFEEDLEFRESLPLDYMQHVGLANSDNDSPGRKAFVDKVMRLMGKLLTSAPVDACADQMAKGFIHDSLPPVLSKEEKLLTVSGSGERWQGGQIVNRVVLEPETQVRVIRSNVLRLVTEDNSVRVYHSVENSREYHGEDLQFVELSEEMAPAVEFLVHSYPAFVSVDDFPIEDVEQKMSLAATLFEKGLIITKEPLRNADEDD